MDGKLHYAHDYLKTREYRVSSDKPVPMGKHWLSVWFTPSGKSLKPDFFTGKIENVIVEMDQ